MVELYDIIKNGHKNNKNNIEGYILDKQLSNKNNQAYFNPENNQLIYNVTGTRNLKDWGTNFYLAAGKIKDTNRYKQAHEGLRKAKEKYKVNDVTVTGNSLGGQIASRIGQKNDNIITYNKAALPFQKVRNNEKSYRISHDPVSIFSRFDKNSETLKNNNIKSNISALDGLNAHLNHNLKNSNIKV